MTAPQIRPVVHHRQEGRPRSPGPGGKCYAAVHRRLDRDGVCTSRHAVPGPVVLLVGAESTELTQPRRRKRNKGPGVICTVCIDRYTYIHTRPHASVAGRSQLRASPLLLMLTRRLFADMQTAGPSPPTTCCCWPVATTPSRACYGTLRRRIKPGVTATRWGRPPQRAKPRLP